MTYARLRFTPWAKNTSSVSSNQLTRNLTLLELETLRELRHGHDTLPFVSLSQSQIPSSHTSFFPGLVAKFNLSLTVWAWRSGTPLAEGMEGCGGDWLYGLLLAWTKVVMVSTAMQEMRVKDTIHGATLAPPARNDVDLGAGRFTKLPSTRKPGFTSR